MKVMVFVKSIPETQTGVKRYVNEQAARDAMDAYNDELVKAGIRLDVAGLTPGSEGARINFNGEKASVIDGPFTESKELVVGYWVWQVRSLQEAIEWAKRCPLPDDTANALELRPFNESGDASA
jgi:hypothetical protein